MMRRAGGPQVVCLSSARRGNIRKRARICVVGCSWPVLDCRRVSITHSLSPHLNSAPGVPSLHLFANPCHGSFIPPTTLHEQTASIPHFLPQDSPPHILWRRLSSMVALQRCNPAQSLHPLHTREPRPVLLLHSVPVFHLPLART